MVYVECKPDKTLVEFVGIPRKEIEHEGGKPGVCRKLRKKTNSFGLVDEDPHAIPPTYIKNLNFQIEEKNVKVGFDATRKNKVVVLCPRLEEWILKVAQKSGINVSDYNLPDDGEKLHSSINSNVENLRKLLKDLENTEEIKFLKKQIGSL